MTKISLVATDNTLLKAFVEVFSDVPEVNVVGGDIFLQDFDTIVSPANSFGFMDGGLDLQISQRLGWDIMTRLQDNITSRPLQELLVGEAVAISTTHTKIKTVICAPTMRTPTRLPEGSINPYLAMKAILCILKDIDTVNHIGIPGLGTGVGEMNPFVVARQMRQAYKDFNTPKFPDTWFDSKVDEWRMK